MSQIEVDKVSSFMCHIRAKIAADNAMPGWAVFLVELLLDEGGDVLFNVVLEEKIVNCMFSFSKLYELIINQGGGEYNIIKVGRVDVSFTFSRA